jgi:hypothetical protein
MKNLGASPEVLHCRLMFNQDDQFVSDGKGNIVVLFHIEHAGEGIDGDGVHGNAFRGALEFPQGGGVALKRQEKTLSL